MKFAVGQPVTRIEDTRLITGEGNYTDDIKFDNMCHGVFVRSPYSHAKILNIDIEIPVILILAILFQLKISDV